MPYLEESCSTFQTLQFLTVCFIFFQTVVDICPNGPYRLAGYSFGACVALEMAHQLGSASRHVDAVILLDGSHSFVASFTGRAKERLTLIAASETETEVLIAFINQIALRLTSAVINPFFFTCVHKL